MSKGHTVVLVALLLSATSASVFGQETGSIGDAITRIDNLYSRAMKLNYEQQGYDLMRQSLDLCEDELKLEPDSFELLWRSARSAAELAEVTRILLSGDWKSSGSAVAKKGVDWAESAKKLRPNRVEGYFWQMTALGTIYDATGPIRFLAMGYLAMSKEDVHASYRLDKSYMDYTPVLALGLYYHNLPRFLGRDDHLALVYYHEFRAETHWDFQPFRQYVNAAEFLISTKDDANVREARALLQRQLSDPTPRPYYHRLAESLLKKIGDK